MFPKKSRFSFKEKLPKNVFNSQSFTLRYAKGSEFKIGVVVSKKVDNRATARNLIKRKVLEAVKKQPELSYSFIFYMRQAAVGNKGLEKEVQDALNKITNNV